MAASMQLPPRRSRKVQEITIRRNRTNLDLLMQMGFPQHRCEKALAATGDKGVQLASDWLLSHVNDPNLDETAPRDYILYLCPVGKLQQELLDFWQKSFQQCGWNRAHNYFPHVTLCSFFKSEDAQISQLAHALKTLCDRLKNVPETIPLEYFSSPNFIGLFISDTMAAILKKITQDFAEEVKKIGVSVEPHKKQLHVSLAYQFQTEEKERLEMLAKNININIPARWDLRIYSRDPRSAKCQVRKVRFTHTPRAADELELVHGDFIFLEESELESSPDGWFMGTSWLTGCSGLFPGNYTERTAETETWTMHRSIPIVGTDILDTISSDTEIREDELYDNHFSVQQPLPVRSLLRNQGAIPKKAKSQQVQNNTTPLSSPKLEQRPLPGSGDQTKCSQMTRQTSDPKLKSKCSAPSASKTSNSPNNNPAKNSSTSKSGPSSSNSSPSHSRSQPQPLTSPIDEVRGGVKRGMARSENVSSTNKGPRQLYVVRHGERIDFTFGKDWIQNSFDSTGNYIRYDLNMPKSLPMRKGGPSDFHKDSPLTVQGHFQARLVGEALKEKGIPITHVYSSPSLRCVETATEILEGLGANLPVNLEPGLFEWLGWYRNGMPKFMLPEELADCGFNVSCKGGYIWSESKYNMDESTEQYYDRCHMVTKEILKRHENEGGHVLLIAHAASLDVCTRQLVGQSPRSHIGFHDMLHKIPYAAMAVAQEGVLVRDTWYLIEPPILPFAHTNNAKYNWTCLTNPSCS